ncbi:MAG: Asp-tRNA(Asn)/Glu-tRNA(Gln) amidotransferase subunit GatB, partial [cyanobacterium endosymbiont of Rhopalodia inflata]
VANFYEKAVETGADAKLVANWVTQDIAAYLNNSKLDITEISLNPVNLGNLVLLIDKETISGKIAKEMLPELLEKGGSPEKLVEAKGMTKISDIKEIEKIIDEILLINPNELEKFRNGKTKLKGFFVGQVMKKTGGRADPKLTNQLVEKKLKG